MMFALPKTKLGPTRASGPRSSTVPRRAIVATEGEKLPLPDYKSREDRKSTNFWDCTPRGPIETTPKPDCHYQIQKGDTLFSIVSRAFGVKPGKQRLALAQVINEDRCNLKYHTTALPEGDKNLFFGSRISFLPRFADSAEEQRSSGDGGKGHSFPIIRIPPETWSRSGTSYDDETGASVKPENHELVDQSCRRWTPPGRDKPCDVSSTVQSYWDAAGRAVSQSFGQLPRPDTTHSNPNEDAAAAFERFFKVSPGEYAAKHDLLVEIRAKFAAINSFFHGAPVHFECGTLIGNNHDQCTDPKTIAAASRRMVELCPRSLEIMFNADAPPTANFTGEKPDFAVTLIHEISHLAMGASNGERYQHEDDFDQLTSEQASMNPESYAAFVSVTHLGGLGKQHHPKPKCR